MGDRNLFLGPHVITAQRQRGIGTIGIGPDAPYGIHAFLPPCRDDENRCPAVLVTAPRYFRMAARSPAAPVALS
jgi:hypothetical protein